MSEYKEEKIQIIGELLSRPEPAQLWPDKKNHQQLLPEKERKPFTDYFCLLFPYRRRHGTLNNQHKRI